MLSSQLSEFGAGKVMKKLTKQACYLYHEFALSGICDAKFFGKKNLTPQIIWRAFYFILFKSYFGQE